MKRAFFGLAILLGSISISALAASQPPQNQEVFITGPAAQEMYNSLNITEVGVHDEHGGPDFARAKYGKLIGCQKDLDGSNVQCWAEVQMIKPKHNYQCISDHLEAIDSDVFFQLAPQEIDQMLADPSAMGHLNALEAAQACDLKQ